MMKVGLTGGIGSGKSFVARIFKSYQIPVFDADKEAKELTHNSPDLIKKIKSVFGKDIYNAEGFLNSNYLAEKVFNDKAALSTLNNIIHPVVKIAFREWAKQQKTDYVIEEAAILIESGAYRIMDKIIVVTAPEHLRIERVVQRDDITETEVRNRMENQIEDKDRLQYADFIIHNDEKALLEPQVKKIHKALLKN